MSNFVGLNRRIRVVAFGAALTVGGVSSALAQAPAGGRCHFHERHRADTSAKLPELSSR